MDDIHETLLYIAYNLENQGQLITIDAMAQTLELTQSRKLHVQKEITWLITNGFLLKKSETEFSLTETGKNEAFKINKIKTKEDFNRMIGRSAASESYLDYCEEVYGYRMYLFNMMDKEQLDYVFNTITICKSYTVLDLGCGIGSILNNIVKKYECNGVGIDQVNEAAVKTCSKTISYIEGDMDNLADYNLKPDITLSVDSLYFSSDPDGLIKKLNGIKNNRMYLFYSQYILDETTKDKTVLHYDNTKIAGILQNNEMEYRVVNYSENEYSLYTNALKVLPKYKIALAREGNSELYEFKLKENRIGKDMYEKCLASRYLYIVP